ncbi:MAG: hypothetical protein ACYC9L_05560 [Sulfuricaulis sp.]
MSATPGAYTGTQLKEHGTGQTMYQGTPFGGDKNGASHIQPAGSLPANGAGLPGEQQDPRFC